MGEICSDTLLVKVVESTNFVTDIHLSLFEVLTLLVSLIGFLFIVLTLRVTNRSLRVTNRTLDANLTMDGLQIMKDLNNFFFNNLDVRKYFYDGAILSVSKSKNPDEVEKVEAACELVLDHLSGIIRNVVKFPELWDVTPWTDYITDIFKNSPELNKYFDNKESMVFRRN